MNHMDDCNNPVTSEAYYDFIVSPEYIDEEVYNLLGIHYAPVGSFFTTIYVPQSQMPKDILNDFGYRIMVRLFGLMDSSSLEASNITKLRAFPFLKLYGQGVLVGIVDTGIDYTHPVFQNANGTSKIASIWDQSIQECNPPEGFGYGTEYTRSQINAALESENPREIVPSVDEIGHGTFLAGVAAGNESNENEFYGVAPDSELVVVKLKQAKQNLKEMYHIPKEAVCYQENDIMLGIRYLIKTAYKLKKPISICIGLGSSQGGHDGLDALSLYLSSACLMNGVAVSIAAGNEGVSKHHYESVLDVGVTNEEIELQIGPEESGFLMEVWGDIPNTFSIEIIAPNGEKTPMIFPKLGEHREVRFIFDTTVIHVYLQLIGINTASQLVLLLFNMPTEGIWKIAVHKMNKERELRLNCWLPISQFISEETCFIKSSPYITTTSSGDLGVPTIVTAYDDVNNNLYLHASRGYGRNDQIVPHIAAPGVNIKGPTLDSSYTVKSGTSIAAAHTAGVSALLLEWGIMKDNIKFMNGFDVNRLLIKGATREIFRAYPNREWGFGKLDVFNTFSNLSGIPNLFKK